MEKEQRQAQRSPASPLQIVGFDGAPPILSGVSDIQRAGTPTIQDTTQTSYQAMENAIVQSRQSVDSISQSNAQTAQVALQAAAKVPRIGELIEPIMAGVELYQETRKEQAEKRDAELGAQLEQKINDLAVQLAMQVETQTTEEGYFTARTEALKEAHTIADEFRQQGLSDEAITPILGIIQSAASSGIRNDLDRYREFATEQRNQAADQAFAALSLQLGPVIGGIANAGNGPQMDIYINEMYSQIDDFFSQYDINDPQLRLQIQTMVLQQASEQALEAGMRNGALANRQRLLAELIPQVNAAAEEFSRTGNYDLYQITLNRLDALYAKELGAGTVVSIASDPLAGLNYQNQLNEFAEAEQEYQQNRFNQMMDSDPAVRNARQQIEVALAHQVLTNQPGEGLDVYNNPDHAMHAGVKTQVELLRQDSELYNELYQRNLEAQEQLYRGAVEFNELLDKYDPTNRFGRLPTTITPEGLIGYQQGLTQVLATRDEDGNIITERGTISAETLAAYEQLLTVANQVAEGTISREMHDMQLRWSPWGIDISNVQNVGELQTRLSNAQSIMMDVQEQMRQQMARPPAPPFQ